MFVKSNRLSRERKPGEQGEGLVSFAAVSNILEIEISEPDAGWEMAKLREIETALEGADRNRKTATSVLSVPGISAGELARMSRPVDDPAIRRVRAELSFLGTHGAVQLILRRAQTTDDDLDSFGLIGARDRSFAVAELDHYIQESNTVVNAWILRLRTLFEFVSLHPKPLFRNLAELKSTEWTTIENEAGTRQTEFQRMLRARAEALVDLPNHKSDDVRDDCRHAIAELAPEAAIQAKLIPPDDYGITREELIGQFNSLPEANQLDLLTQKWALVRGPEMIPVLRRIIARAQPLPPPKTGTEFSMWPGPISLGEQALVRLQQLAPDQAKQILIEDIAKTTPRFALFSVNRLPSQEVPQADIPFTSAFQKEPAAAIAPIARFGTAALYSAVAASYQKENWSCGEQEWFLAYFLRIKPERGRKLLADALANPNGCGLLLETLSRVAWNGDIEAAAVTMLSQAKPWTASGAARILALDGSPAVEQALWRRLEQWNEQWRGRVKELARHPITGNDPNGEDRRFGDALIRAIASGQAWFLDEPRRKRLAALCLDDWTRKIWSKETSGEARIEVGGRVLTGESHFRVSQGSLEYTTSTLEEFKTKLAQFPAETAFHWCPPSFDPVDSWTAEERQENYRTLAEFLGSRHKYLEACSN